MVLSTKGAVSGCGLRRVLSLAQSPGAPVQASCRNVTLPKCDTRRLNLCRYLDRNRDRSFNQFSSGVPVALAGQEGIRCVSPLHWRGNSGAAPATVGGELLSKMPLGFAVQGLGRRRGATTREPGDLPERSHPSTVRGARVGRTSAAVTKRFVTRLEAAMTILLRILSTWKFGLGEIAKAAILLRDGATHGALTTLYCKV
jgi:hypothetical protein